MSFHVGQKVVCIDVSPTTGRVPIELSLNAIYTVSDVIDTWMGIGLAVYEVLSPEVDGYFKHFGAFRFRPIVERKTDISVFTAMLNPSKQGVDA